MLLCEQVPVNYQTQQAPPETSGDPNQQQAPEAQQVQQMPEPVEYMPLKKYHLAQKLSDLNIRIKQNNLKNEALETVLKFVDVLSYETILSLSTGIIRTIKEDIVRAQNAKKQV